MFRTVHTVSSLPSATHVTSMWDVHLELHPVTIGLQ